MPSPNPPQAQGAQVAVSRAVSNEPFRGTKQRWLVTLAVRDRISKSLDRPFSAVSRAVSFMFRGVGEPTWSLAT